MSSGQECCDRDGSFYNEKEAQFVVAMINSLVLSGVEPEMIGIVTLYKSQMLLITNLLQSNKYVCIWLD